jgi:ribosomal protein L37E
MATTRQIRCSDETYRACVDLSLRFSIPMHEALDRYIEGYHAETPTTSQLWEIIQKLEHCPRCQAVCYERKSKECPCCGHEERSNSDEIKPSEKISG